MGMLRIFVLAGTAAAFMCSVARAADVESLPVYDWTGFYAGAHAGYHWGSGGGVRFDETGDTRFPGQDFIDDALAAGLPRKMGGNLDGFIGGGQLGYNWQSDSLVLGVETDLSYLDLKEQDSEHFPGGSSPNFTFGARDLTTDQSIDFLGTTRLRLGFAMDRTLLYLTGGLAYGDTEFRYQAVSGGASISGGDKDFKVGWTIGGGLEYGIGESITLRGEYLYYDLGDSSSTDAFGPSFITTETHSAEFRGNIIRAGVNWRF